MILRDGTLKETVLCFVFRNRRTELLMIQKKRGQGAGKWNVPGGKLASGEIPEQAAIRETEEETGIRPVTLSPAGKLEFYFPESEAWDNICTVYTSDHFIGSLIPETEECSAHWVPLDEIPYDKMWDADRRWIPLLLEGHPFHRVYSFDSHDQVLSEEIRDPHANV